jgi:hypothetical protein
MALASGTTPIGWGAAVSGPGRDDRAGALVSWHRQRDGIASKRESHARYGRQALTGDIGKTKARTANRAGFHHHRDRLLR